ncbi:MAG: hypothetical protein ACLFQV_06070 [Vulcanimicrobiota bacterium]
MKLITQINQFKIGYLMFVIFISVVIWATLQPIPPADTYWMLKSGEVITQNKAIPRTDIFSYTADSQTWHNHEWLAAIIFFIIYKMGNFFALYLFKSIIVSATYLLVFTLALKRTSNNWSLASIAGILMVLISGGNLYFDVRAYLFTYFFLALTLLIIEAGYHKPRYWMLYLLIPITLLWVNMHGGFILCYVIQLFFIVSIILKIILNRIDKGSFFQAVVSGEQNKKSLKHGITVFLFSIAAGFINPYGFQNFLYPFSFSRDKLYKAFLIEWVPPDYLGVNLPLTLTAVVVLFLTVWFWKKFRISDFLLLLGFSYLAMSVVRHSVLYSIVVLPIAALILKSIIEWINTRFNIQDKKPVENTGVVFLVLTLAVLGILSNRIFKTKIDELTMENILFPREAVEFIRSNKLPGPMFNPYEWGGYFIWHLYPDYKVFIDGRANTVYPEEIYRKSIMALKGQPEWEETMEEYDINFVVTNKYLNRVSDHRLSDKLSSSDNWIMIFEDNVEKVFIKKNQQNREILEKYRNGKLLIPDSLFQKQKAANELIKLGRLKEAETVLRNILKENPGRIPALLNLAYISGIQGDFNESELLLRKVLKIQPGNINALYGLSQVYKFKKDYLKSREYLKKILEKSPENKRAKRDMEEINKKLDVSK